MVVLSYFLWRWDTPNQKTKNPPQFFYVLVAAGAPEVNNFFKITSLGKKPLEARGEAASLIYTLLGLSVFL